MDSKKLEMHFNVVLDQLKGGRNATPDDLKLAMASVAIPTMLQSSSRPGAVANMTTEEFQNGTQAEDPDLSQTQNMSQAIDTDEEIELRWGV